MAFSQLFHHATTTKLFDDHLWISVIARPVKSRFSRAERLSCCLCLLLTSMLTSAMFYGQELNDSTTKIVIGPFLFSFEQVK